MGSEKRQRSITDGGSVSGDRKLKESPHGSHLVAHIRPPSASIIERQIARPMPVPPGFVV